MGRNIKRILSSLVTVVLLFNIIGACGACSRTDKTKENQKKSCEGVVEDYLIYLRSGKLDRLHRYADPDGDPFQDLDFSTSAQENLWDAFVGKMEFELGETEIDGDEATITVTVSVPDAAKALKSGGEVLSYDSAADLISGSKKMTEAEIEFPLQIDEDDDSALISSTEDLYDLVMEQFDILTEAIPKGDEALKTKADAFMKKFVDLDLYYLYSHSQIDGLDDYEEYYEGFYQAAFSFFSYELEYVRSIDDSSAEFIVHAHLKDTTKVAKDFFSDPEKIAPMLYNIILTFMRNDLTDDLYDNVDFNTLVPYFRDELASSPDIDVDITLNITSNSSKEDDFRVSGDFAPILPFFDPWEYIDELTEEESLLTYKAAGRQLHDDGKITDLEFRQVLRSIEGPSFDEAKVDEVLTKYGFELTSSGYGGYVYMNGENLRINIDTDLEIMQPAFDNGEELIYLNEGIKNGEYRGTVTGNCYDFTFQGVEIDEDTSPDSGEPAESTLYGRCISTFDSVFQLGAFNYTDEQIDTLNAIIDELGLEA